MIKIITDKNFKEEVLESRQPVLVDFWASWCPPCKMVEPMIEAVARAYEGKIKVAKLNIDQYPRAAEEFSVKGVPAFILFNSGEIIERRVGAQFREQIEKMISKAIRDC